MRGPEAACLRVAVVPFGTIVSTLPASKPQPSRLNQGRSRTLVDVGVELGGRTIAVPKQCPDDILAGTHDGVAAAGGVAGAVAGDVADAGLCGEQ